MKRTRGRKNKKESEKEDEDNEEYQYEDKEEKEAGGHGHGRGKNDLRRWIELEGGQEQERRGARRSAKTRRRTRVWLMSQLRSRGP